MSVPEGARVHVFLQHAVKAIQRVAAYTVEMDHQRFISNGMVQDAVIRNIEVVGEAARNVERYHPAFALKHPQVPWKDLYAMRNRVSHGYFSIDLDIVWQTVQRDMPLLGKQLADLLAEVAPTPGD